jgi:putative flippase GtrA
MVLLNLFLWLGMSNELAPLPVFAIAIPVNFLLVRFVFKHKKNDDETR